ncbi:HEPN domain-containing protein [bacterium]|nr:HEPN domain-containing protein [bacterium]
MEYNLELINKAIQKSDEAMLSALSNFKDKHYDACQNRLYYSIFYMVSALAYKENFITSKHSQLMGWFNKKYIYDENIFDTKIYAIYRESFSNRQKSDYDFTYTPTEEDLIISIEETKYFLNSLKEYLSKLLG